MIYGKSWLQRKKESKSYLKNLDYKSLKSLYDDLAAFYDDTTTPFENLGIGKEVQFKFKYEPKHKAIFIACECSRNNRVEHKGIFKYINFDWFTNLFYLPVKELRNIKRTRPYEDSEVKFYTHAGFTASWKSVEDTVYEKIAELRKNNNVKTICIYGWSYGGAMAQFTHEACYYKYEMKEGLPVTTFTIGAPRIYYAPYFRFWLIPDWYALKERFQHCYMIQNNNDIVTHQPPLAFGSKHIVKGIKVGDKFSIKKFFNPWVYHLKETYTPLFDKYCDDRS